MWETGNVINFCYYYYYFVDTMVFLNILVFIFEHPKHHIPVHHGLEGPLQLLNGLYALVDSISLTQKVYTDFSGKLGWKRGGKGKEEKIDSERHLYFQLAKLLWYGSPPSTFGAYFQMSFDILGKKMEFCYVYGIFEYQVFTSRVRNCLLIFHSTDIIYS